jgi:hypothetical protein
MLTQDKEKSSENGTEFDSENAVKTANYTKMPGRHI